VDDNAYACGHNAPGSWKSHHFNYEKTASKQQLTVKLHLAICKTPPVKCKTARVCSELDVKLEGKWREITVKLSGEIVRNSKERKKKDDIFVLFY
jgi:hypothetical protein